MAYRPDLVYGREAVYGTTDAPTNPQQVLHQQSTTTPLLIELSGLNGFRGHSSAGSSSLGCVQPWDKYLKEFQQRLAAHSYDNSALTAADDVSSREPKPTLLAHRRCS